MNKLEEQIKLLIDKAEDKELIDALISLNNTANTMVEEHDQLLAKHDELKKAYKEAVIHQSFETKPADTVSPQPVSFEALLNEIINK